MKKKFEKMNFFFICVPAGRFFLRLPAPGNLNRHSLHDNADAALGANRRRWVVWGSYFSDFLAKYSLPNFFWNFSTRPAASTNFCLPV